MDLLRNLFGNLTSGIIRLAVTAGVLFLCYLFIVKPVLKTTDDAIHQTGFDKIGESLEGLGPAIRHEVNQTIRITRVHGASPQRLIRCIKHADQDVQRIQRCTRRF